MSNLLVADHPLLVLPSLAQKVGLNESLVLQQIHYWLRPQHNPHQAQGKSWVYNTYEQWREQFPFWSHRTIQRIIHKLERLHILDSFVSKKSDVTKFYTINYNVLDKLVERPPHEGDEHALDDDTMPLSMTTNCHGQSRQSGTFEHDNLACSIYTETPTKTPSEIPSSFSSNDNGNALSPEGRMKKNHTEKSWAEWMTVWNTTVQNHLSPDQVAHVTPKRLKALGTLMTTVFFEGIELWRDYCERIAENAFLMGENDTGFRVNLDWALDADNAVRVLEGAIYGQKPYAKDTEQSEEEIFQGLTDEFGSSKKGTLWLKVCRRMLAYEDALSIKTWFSDLRISAISTDSITITTPNSFFRDYVENNFGFKLRHILREYHPNKEVRFVVRNPKSFES